MLNCITSVPDFKHLERVFAVRRAAFLRDTESTHMQAHIAVAHGLAVAWQGAVYAVWKPNGKVRRHSRPFARRCMYVYAYIS